MPDEQTIIPVGEEERKAGQEKAIETLQQGADIEPIKRPMKEFIDDDVVRNLIVAFQKGFTVRNACLYAGIGKTAFYDKCKEDPDFADTMAHAKLQLVVLSGNRIASIIEKGEDKVAGPLAKWIYERQQPEEYGQKVIQNDNSKKYVNNFLVLNNDQISDITKQPDIDNSDPSELLESLEEASKLDAAAEEESAA